jgi:hypothetical protein
VCLAACAFGRSVPSLTFALCVCTVASDKKRCGSVFFSFRLFHSSFLLICVMASEGESSSLFLV